MRRAHEKGLLGYWSHGLDLVWKIAMSDFWILTHVDTFWEGLNSGSQGEVVYILQPT